MTTLRIAREQESSMPRRLVVLLLTAFAAIFAPVFAAAPALAQNRISVVASFSILGDLVKNVGNDRVDVATLVGPNGDVHVYSPTPADAKTLAVAKAVFVNGLGLEGWMIRLVAASGTKAPLVVASKGVKAREMADRHDAGHMVPDPHAWQSVANAKIYVANIRDALSSADPAGKEIYAANAQSYLGKLDALETDVKAAIAKIPADRREIVVTHDAFGYFGDAYGLEFIAPEGVSTDAEASAKNVGAIISQIKRQKIPAVFMENITDPRLVQQIAKETGATIAGTLYSDALSEPNGPAGSYIDMMRNNIRAIDNALVL
jgi:zinc/manganese transport system substrate-binding protein